MNYKKQNSSLDELNANPMVSVIIPAYNAEKIIEQTILSVKNQTYRNWELLIIDNCSSDNTHKLITSYKTSKIRIFKTEQNSGGPAIPRNIGIKNANGKYLAFLDADDIWKNFKLQVQLRYLQKCDFVSSLASTIDAKSNVINQAKPVINKYYEFSDMVKRNRVVTSSVIVSRKKFLSVMFDEDPLLNGIEDYHSYLTYALLHGPIFTVGESLVERRIMISSLGDTIFGEKRLAQSTYCLTKVVLAHGRYNCYVYGLFRRLLSYVKRRILN